MSGVLYESYGIAGPVTIAVSAAVVSIALLTMGQRRTTMHGAEL